jgi:Histidine kinase-, DNA gyrase B-, and HSP90-like ATPase
MAARKKSPFQFAISLSVLNHLGRNLYRNFITVLGEAISNAWDADAKNVWIEIDPRSTKFSIKDDGVGMTAEDFQNKFLKIGYSKRVGGRSRSRGRRPFIGAKGIGKLALLSCARRISVFSRKRGKDYIGGVIDNSGLDRAITQDLTPENYPLEALNMNLIKALSKSHGRGTIIVFEGARDQIRSSVAHIRKMIAMSFHFSVIDPTFSIFVNGDEVTVEDLADLASSTEFLWTINSYSDDFTAALPGLQHPRLRLTTSLKVKGFVGSVVKPRNLKITGTDDRATIDLFVNGRLREKNILRHIPTQRIVESYIYGQIHFDAMDSRGKDPFTSSREGIVEDDKNFKALLEYLKGTALPTIFDKWDELRLARGREGDEENTTRKSKKERKARDLYSAAQDDYKPGAEDEPTDTVESWLSELRDDAEFNLTSYVDCFLSENLVRKYIEEAGRSPTTGIVKTADKWRKAEADKKGKANISFDVRKSDDDITYLGMDDLAFTAEGKKESEKNQSLWRDAVLYAPVRNVVGHTGLLTETAKSHLRITHENIKARVRSLLAKPPEP